MPHMARQIRDDVAAQPPLWKIGKHLGLRQVIHSGLVRGRPRTTPIDGITLSDKEGREAGAAVSWPWTPG
jgi:hypothetical protein